HGRGKTDASVAHFRKAVELDPRNLHARWWLAKMLDRQHAPGNEAEYQKQIEEILNEDAGNLAALVELGAIAARRGDNAALQRVIQEVDKQSAVWDPGTRAAVAGMKASDASTAVSQFMRVANLGERE